MIVAGVLAGQTAIVTGASGGLGAHFARLLASEGAAVALTARRLDMVETLAGEIAGAGGKAMALSAASPPQSTTVSNSVSCRKSKAE